MVSTSLELEKTPRFLIFSRPGTCVRDKAVKTVISPPRKAAKAASSKTISGDGAAASGQLTMVGGVTNVTVSIGARKVLLEDVLLVAVHGARVDLHPASLDKACTPAPTDVGCDGPDGNFDNRETDDVLVEDALSNAAARSTIFARIVSFMNGRAGVRSEVLTFLSGLLNAGVTPLLPQQGGDGPAVAKAVLGGGSCLFRGEVRPLADVVSSCGLSPLPRLTLRERSTLALGRFDQIGMAAMAAGAAENAIEIADGVAALTCEAARASTSHFEPVNFDVCRPHRGQMTCAERLRLLLEGSKLVNSKKGKGADAEAVSTIPQCHGPARDAVNAASSTDKVVCHHSLESMASQLKDPLSSIVTELNASEAGPLGVGPDCVPPRNGQQTELVIAFLSEAIKMLTRGAKGRAAALRDISEEKGPEATNGGTREEGASGACSTTVEVLIRALQVALASEMVVSLGLLGKEEEKANAAAAAKAQAVANGQAGGPPRGGSGPAPAGDNSGLTAAQAAKIEAKRAEKAAKAAAKAAAKKDKKKGQGLGMGCSELRQRVLGAGTSGAGRVGLETAEIEGKLNPFHVGEGALGPFLCALSERLTSGGAQRKPKVAKGARDILPEQMRIREQAFTAIRNVFKRHGAVEIDTPVFELKETLTGKYGEDSKLIYDLADQGGELLALRYDLTVPFARYLAVNAVGNIKRFHIGKVYRRDQPNMQLGRYREFYQCDFDIAGSYGLMVPDAEVLSVACEILSSLPIGNFLIKLNHRRLLDAILDICGCPAEKFRPICSAIDKLDKTEWPEVRKEMVEEKGLAAEAADKIGTFVLGNAGPAKELWAKLTEQKTFGDHPDVSTAMSELELLFKYLEAMGTLEYVSFDLSLARGLTYYTGLIYECIVVDGGVRVGSIAAGGRYDNLVGMFSGTQVPCIGVSIGIERVLTIMEKKMQEQRGEKGLPSNVQVYVASVGAGLLEERMKLGRTLWSSDISAEYSTSENPKLKKQMDEVLQRGIPFMVIVGEEEVKQGVVKLKDMGKRTEEVVRREDLSKALREAGCRLVTEKVDLLEAPAQQQPSGH